MEPKILFVDDEAIFLATYSQFCEQESFSALFAANADEALAILAREEVHLIVSDFHMPGMDGIELLQRIRIEYPRIIRIVVSGVADECVLTKAINCGHIYYFIAKPFDAPELARVIRDGQALYARHQCEEEAIQALLLQSNLIKVTAAAAATTSVRRETGWDAALPAELLNDLPMAVMAVDKNGTIRYCNPWTSHFFATVVPSSENISKLLPMELLVAVAAQFEESGDTVSRVTLAGGAQWLAAVRTAAGRDWAAVCLLPIPADQTV